MKQTINFNNFVDAFHSMGRGKQFSYDALKAIFEYIEDYERDSGEDVELDVIAICCDFSENSWQDVIDLYSIDVDYSEDDSEIIQQVKDFLECESVMVGYSNDKNLSDNVVYQSF